MGEIFFKITGTVMVLNIIFLILPDGKYEKYAQFIAGLIVILTIAGSIFKVEIEHSVLNFDQNAFEFDNSKLKSVAEEQIIEETLQKNIADELGIDVTIDVEFADRKIHSIDVFTDSERKNEITDVLLSYCDINRKDIVVK